MMVLGVLVFGGCASVTAPDITLVGNFANPYEPVLAGLCHACNINACIDHNVLAQTCAQGLPIQGLIASGVSAKACPDLGYATSGAFTPMVPPQACIDAAIAAAAKPVSPVTPAPGEAPAGAVVPRPN